MSLRPWRKLGPVTGPRRAARWWLALCWLGCGAALWGLLGTRGWLLGQRPRLVLEAYLADAATPAQVEDFSRTVQGQPWCCGLGFVSADEARAEAGRDDRVRPLLEAYGSNPFLRSYRLTLCPEALDRHAEAVAWLKAQPGVVSVRAPSAQAGRVLDGERQLKSIARAAFTGLLGFAVLGAWFGLGALAAALGPELEVYADLGAAPGRLYGRALTALAAPAVLGGAITAIALELASVLARFTAGFAPDGPLAALPAFPHAGGAVLVGIAAGSALLAALLVVRRRGLLRPR